MNPDPRSVLISIRPELNAIEIELGLHHGWCYLRAEVTDDKPEPSPFIIPRSEHHAFLFSNSSHIITTHGAGSYSATPANGLVLSDDFTYTPPEMFGLFPAPATMPKLRRYFHPSVVRINRKINFPEGFCRVSRNGDIFHVLPAIPFVSEPAHIKDATDFFNFRAFEMESPLRGSDAIEEYEIENRMVLAGRVSPKLLAGLLAQQAEFEKQPHVQKILKEMESTEGVTPQDRARIRKLEEQYWNLQY